MLGTRIFLQGLCMEFYKFCVAISKILLFGHFLAGKLPKKGGHILDYGHEIAEKQNFQNLYINFVELHTENLQTKFQVPSI